VRKLYDRVLKVDLLTCVDMFESTKWKFYEVNEDHIRVEVPKQNENVVIELTYKMDSERDYIVEQLRQEGFKEQEIRPWRGY